MQDPNGVHAKDMITLEAVGEELLAHELVEGFVEERFDGKDVGGDWAVIGVEECGVAPDSDAV